MNQQLGSKGITSRVSASNRWYDTPADGDPDDLGVAAIPSKGGNEHATIANANANANAVMLLRDDAEKMEASKTFVRIKECLGPKPRTLSGGQRPRVAIVRDPQVFLFDEPLSNLDAETWVQIGRRSRGSTPIWAQR